MNNLLQTAYFFKNRSDKNSAVPYNIYFPLSDHIPCHRPKSVVKPRSYLPTITKNPTKIFPIKIKKLILLDERSSSSKTFILSDCCPKLIIKCILI